VFKPPHLQCLQSQVAAKGSVAIEVSCEKDWWTLQLKITRSSHSAETWKLVEQDIEMWLEMDIASAFLSRPPFSSAVDMPITRVVQNNGKFHG